MIGFKRQSGAGFLSVAKVSFIVIAIALLSLSPLNSQEHSEEQALFRPLQEKFEQAERKQVNLYAPQIYREASELYESAQKSYRAGKKRSEIQKKIQKAGELLDRAFKISRVTQTELASLIETRDKIVKLGYSAVASSEMIKSEDHFIKAVKKAEEGNLDDAHNEADKAFKQYRLATIKWLKDNALKKAGRDLRALRKTIRDDEYKKISGNLKRIEDRVEQIKEDKNVVVIQFQDEVVRQIEITLHNLKDKSELQTLGEVSPVTDIILEKTVRSPFVRSFTINDNAPYTNSINVTLNNNVLNASQMRFGFRENPEEHHWTEWEDYAPTREYYTDFKDWQREDGIREIHAEFKDSEGHIAKISDTIILDTTEPTITGGPTTSPDQYGWFRSDVTVHFDAEDNLSGIAYITPDTIVTNSWQFITGIATDSAGNTATCTLPRIPIKKIIIVAVMDGAANKKKIFSTTRLAAKEENVDLNGHYYNYKEFDSSFEGPIIVGSDEEKSAMAFINTMVNGLLPLGINKSDIRLLLVGKSLGGAKFYRMLYLYADDLNDFEKVAAVFVDSHCVPPSDEGSPGWNNYVYFTGSGGSNSTYNLAWNWSMTFNSPSSQDDYGCKLRIFNIYSRQLYDSKLVSILGYSFSSAFRNLNCGDWNGFRYPPGSAAGQDYLNGMVYNLELESIQPVTHFNIDNCRETKNLIREALEYLKN